MTGKQRPLIAITIGDAAGIGPEVVAKSLAMSETLRLCRPVLLGSSEIMAEAAHLIGANLKLNPIARPADALGQFGTVDILDLHNLDRRHVTIGQKCPACGKAAMEYIAKAVQLALAGEIKALVTAPINKEATMQAGYGEVGHLEYIAALTRAKEYATMLQSGSLRVVHLTTHYSLREACGFVKKDKILGKIRLTDRSFRGWGFKSPRIAVAALNPHGGEGGIFGREEIDEISPAIAEARAQGIDAQGPFPADSVFYRAIGGEFDVVVVMYHDQGHIPIKVYGFEKSVSVALGLPLLRTSVDHGTAFDIAGKGIANHESMVEAIRVAVDLAGRS